MIDNGESSIPLLQQEQQEFSDQSTTLFDASERPNRSTDEHQGIVAQMKDLISREETWTLMVYYSVYKLPSAIIMFALTAVIFTPLLNYFELIPSSDIFLQFCHWLNISTSMGYLIWCGLSILALPFILIICGQIYIMERRFLKVTQSNC
ncbi:hypothetical protein HDV02_003833 [Globomyces sp. JEL0801]|nr:hypothetical protein HDV02_003833 [Globomyces sp. JEL0801]